MSSLFENAPISLTISAVTLLLTMLYGGSTHTNLDIERVVTHGEFGRLVSSQFIFSTPSQAMFAVIMLYTCRLFERQLGTKKYGAFFFSSLLLTLMLNVGLSFVFRTAGIRFAPAAGPYFFLFAQMALFHKYVPKVSMTQYVCFGLEFSEKSWIYLLAIQMFFGEGLSSVIAGINGLLVGMLYDRNFFGIQKLRLPALLERGFGIFSNCLAAVFPSGRRVAPPNRHNRAIDGMTSRNGEFEMRELGSQRTNLYGSMAPPNDYTLPPPDEDSIQSLMNLGFERDAVIRALRSSGNNVDAAANRLFS